MTTYKKKLLTVIILSAVFVLMTFIGLAYPKTAYAQSLTIAEPKVEGLTDSKKAPYKDMFYVGEYNYAAESYTLNYRYYQPQDMSQKVPLIIFLHGRGERGSDNDSQLNNAILRPFIENENSKFYGAMVIAPQCPVKEYNNGWVNLFSDDETANALAYKNYSVDNIAESTECKAIVSLIEDTCNNKNIDRNRIYLIGLSQGAMATWDLLARHSELFAAAVPIAGVGDTSKAEIYADIPIYAFHGNADTTVKYDTATPKMYEAINAVGKGNMHFVTFEGGPHAIWEAAITFKGSGELPALEDWLFSQKRSEEKSGGCRSSVNMPGCMLVLAPATAAVAVARLLKRKKA